MSGSLDNPLLVVPMSKGPQNSNEAPNAPAWLPPRGQNPHEGQSAGMPYLKLSIPLELDFSHLCNVLLWEYTLRLVRPRFLLVHYRHGWGSSPNTIDCRAYWQAQHRWKADEALDMFFLSMSEALSVKLSKSDQTEWSYCRCACKCVSKLPQWNEPTAKTPICSCA